MTRLRFLAMAALLAACAPAVPTGSTGTPRPPRATTPATTPAPAATATPRDAATPTPAPIVASLAPVPPAPTAGAPGVQAALAGVVKAPAALVTAAGGLISDKGLGLVSHGEADPGGHNGGGYRVLALDEVPVAGVRVTLADAAGAAVTDAAGTPIAAVTDGAGRYAFAGTRPGVHLVVKAELPKVGAISRIVAPGVAEADLDLGSTLAAGYILDRYVATQADPRTTLARLPADVEAETSLAAGRAAAAGDPPLTLATADVVARMEALRRGDAALDGQLEAVKQLLIVAGTSNLGDGQPAREVVLRSLSALVPGPGGILYMQSPADKTVWRLDPDGRVRAFTGPAAAGAAARGVLVGAADVHLDPRGRVVVVSGDGGGVVRVAPDGTVEDLAGAALAGVRAAVPIAGDAVLATTWAVGAGTTVWKLVAGQAPAKLYAEPPNASPSLYGIRRGALQPDGSLRLLATVNLVPALLRFDPAAPAAATWVGKPGENGFTGYDMAYDGTAFGFRSGGGAGTFPANADAPRFAVGTMWAPAAPDGAGGWWTTATSGAQNTIVSHGPADAQVPVAGLGASGDVAGVLSLSKPTDFVVAGDGTLIVADDGKLLRVPPGGTPATWAAAPAAPEATGTPTPMAFKGLRRMADGRVYAVATEASAIVGRDAVFQVAADGAATLVHRALGTIFSLADDGRALLLAETKPGSTFMGQLTRVDAAGARVLAGPSADLASRVVFFDADGMVVARQRYDGTAFLDSYDAWRLAPDGTLAPMAGLDGLPPQRDPQGRVLRGGKTVTRVEASGAVTILAGPGGKHFAGTGVDAGLGGVSALRFGPTGDLYMLDEPARQIKRIAAEDL